MFFGSPRVKPKTQLFLSSDVIHLLRFIVRVMCVWVWVWVCVCVSVVSGWVMLAEASGNVSVSSPFVFFSLSPSLTHIRIHCFIHTHTHTHTHTSTTRHVIVRSFFNHSIQTHTHSKQMWKSVTVITQHVSLFLHLNNFIFYSSSSLKIHYFKSFILCYLAYYNFSTGPF